MRWFLLILNLSGCTAQPQLSADLPKEPFDTAPNAAPIQLDVHPIASIQSKQSNRMKAGDATFQLVAQQDSQKDPLNANLYVSVPFEITPNQQRFAPKDVEVRIGDRQVPFAKTQHQTNKDGWGWRFSKQRLLIAAPRVASGTKVTVVHHGLAKTQQQLSSFGPFTFRERDDAYQGLNLPEGHTATWSLTLPPSARFQTQIGAHAVATQPRNSHSATVTLKIQNSEGSLVAAQKRVYGNQLPENWAVDLSKWSSQSVTLSLSATGHNSELLEAAFLGAPTIFEGLPKAAPRRVVVIGLDTTRPDHFGFAGYHRNTTPELDRRLPTFTRFDHAWAPAPRTRPSFRSATTGQLPLNAVGAKNIGERFDEAGFATAGFVANIHLNPRFGFDVGFDEWHLNTRAKATEQIDKSLAWLRRNEARDTYLFLHLMDPHLFYVAPERYASRFPEVKGADLPASFTREHVIRRMKQSKLSDVDKNEIRRRYDSELAYTSYELNRFLNGLDAMAGNTLVVIHSDHGEEFWEHNGFEHNHTLFEEVTRALLLIRPPANTPLVPLVTTPVMLADIGPTLVDYAGLEHDTFDGRSLRGDIAGQQFPTRPIPIGHLMYDKEAWGVILNNHKYFIETASGKESLYDLSSDPQETNNIARHTDLQDYIRALAVSHKMPAGPGWRIPITAHAQPLTLSLPAPALAAGILDPESSRSRRANLAWGERPKYTKDDVATTHLSADRQTLTVIPKGKTSGVAYVLFEKPQTPPTAQAAISSGTVIVPPPNEAERMEGGALNSVRDSDLELLKALGYISP